MQSHPPQQFQNHQQHLYDQGPYDAGFNEGEEEDAYYGYSYDKDIVSSNRL